MAFATPWVGRVNVPQSLLTTSDSTGRPALRGAVGFLNRSCSYPSVLPDKIVPGWQPVLHRWAAAVFSIGPAGMYGVPSRMTFHSGWYVSDQNLALVNVRPIRDPVSSRTQNTMSQFEVLKFEPFCAWRASCIAVRASFALSLSCRLNADAACDDDRRCCRRSWRQSAFSASCNKWA